MQLLYDCCNKSHSVTVDCSIATVGFIKPSSSSFDAFVRQITDISSTNHCERIYGYGSMVCQRQCTLCGAIGRERTQFLLPAPPSRYSGVPIGGRAFPVAGSQIWNSLPDTVVSASTLRSFQHQLKTFLFQRSFIY